MLKGYEEKYFQEIIDKYYLSNKSSHISGFVEEHKKNNIVRLRKDDDLVEMLIKEYILNIFPIQKNENYKIKKETIVNLFSLDLIITSLCIKNKYL